MSLASQPIVETDRRPVLLVVPGNLGGSVEHFYHFLFGYLLPFLEHCHAMRGSHRFQMRDCGPMNRLLRGLPGFHIAVKPVYKVLETVVGTVPGSAGTARIMVPGFDAPHAYNPERFRRIRRIVARLFGPQIDSFARAHPLAASERLVLVIDRAPPPPEYLADGTEAKSGGSARRSVPNMAEVFAAIAERHDALLVRLEECSLLEQVFLFSRAWRVVGQHGAGLSHMIWARPDAGLVEIMPNPKQLSNDAQWQAAYFATLCRSLALPRRMVEQTDPHDPVPPEAVVAALAALD
ncbi:glycosyltransferase 61 family protein [Roseomonas sp. CECT 9278]|uniref:glycosyltransferase 61 family protein n=1 Tax=Roseomonas sp. CECT 9278 TaxID=2845823 RepID=UPI001E6534B6|nr:glycosyltransferase family 61 protein [Roseomonas sp. CECT 9278]CAH0265506.1 hypothetical protein ROS9278_03513 [Roseomonas sp. CECT 9278]